MTFPSLKKCGLTRQPGPPAVRNSHRICTEILIQISQEYSMFVTKRFKNQSGFVVDELSELERTV